MPDRSVGLILLAAGGSSRMGRRKQLLSYNGKTLLRLSAEAAAGSSCRPIIAVLGEESNLLRTELDDLPIDVVLNSSWERGMGTSIRTGLSALGGMVDAAVIMLCDQPMVTSALIETMVAAYGEGDDIAVASEYGDSVGVPALFDSSLFPDLMALPDSDGAKAVIQANEDRIARVTFPGGAVDIDTPEEYNALVAAQEPPKGVGDDDTLGGKAPTSEEQAIIGSGPPVYTER